MIIGTAGHIDHGKTTLVRALTGVDTDRLAQEKAQGISIELGYAYSTLGADRILGFIDVPGHERLVHTMAAGAGGIDFGLLVVAADDGLMPQTREHVAILDLLGVRRGAVAITRADRVDDARLQAVRSSLASLASAGFLATAPVFALDARDPGHPGLLALRAHLRDCAHAAPSASEIGLFRLAVDRVFTLTGHGTVVTGTVYSGQLDLDAPPDLRLMPQGLPVRVRGLRSQGQPSRRARAGERCALNLGGLARQTLARGDWIADAACFTPTQRIDAVLRLLDDAAQPLRSWTPVHLHLGASHGMAHVVPLSVDSVAAGQTALVQLVTDAPLCAMPADRFIVRNAQARQTLGGGRVLDAQAPDRKRRSPARLAWLRAVRTLLDTGAHAAIFDQAPHGLDAPAVQRLGLTALTDAAARPATLIAVGRLGEPDWRLIARTHWQSLGAAVDAALQAHHAASPDEPGLDAARLRRICHPRLPDAVWPVLLADLQAGGRIARSGPWWHLPDHRLSLLPQEAALAQRLLAPLHAGGIDPPWVRDLARDQGLAEDAVRALLVKLVRRGLLFQVVRDWFFHREALCGLAQTFATLAQDGGVRAAQFRDATGLGRKRAVQVLEYFDRVGYARRLRDVHVLRPECRLFDPVPADAQAQMLG